MRKPGAWLALFLSVAAAARSEDGRPSLELLKERLRDPSVGVRWSATAELEREGPPAVPLLMEALGDLSGRVRASAAHALGRIGPKAAAAQGALKTALRDPNWEVRAAAAGALGSIGLAPSDAVPALLAALEDSDPDVTKAALYGLAGLGPECVEAMAALTQALASSNGNERLWIEARLARMGPAALPPLLARLRDRGQAGRAGAAQALVLFGREAPLEIAPALEEALLDPDPAVRAGAAWGLARMEDAATNVVAELTLALEDIDPRVRQNAALGLLRRGERAAPAVAALTEALRDPSPEVRREVAHALGWIGAEAWPAHGSLVERLGDEDAWVRERAAGALGAIWAAVADAIRKEEEDPDAREQVERATEEVRRAAPVIVGALGAALKDRRYGVRRAAAESLGKMGSRAGAAARALAAMLRDRVSDVRRSAGRTLGLLGADASVALPELVAALKDPEPHVREAAAATLGGLGRGAGGAVPGLREILLTDADADVLKATTEALGKILPTAEALSAPRDHRLAIRLMAVKTDLLVGEPLVLLATYEAGPFAVFVAGDLAHGGHTKVMIDRGTGFQPFAAREFVTACEAEGYGPQRLQGGHATIEYVLSYDEGLEDWVFPKPGRHRVALEGTDGAGRLTRSNEVVIHVSRPRGDEKVVHDALRSLGALMLDAWPWAMPLTGDLARLASAHPRSAYLQWARIRDVQARAKSLAEGFDPEDAETPLAEDSKLAKKLGEQKVDALVPVAQELAEIPGQFQPEALLTLATLQEGEAQWGTIERLGRNFPRRAAGREARQRLRQLDEERAELER